MTLSLRRIVAARGASARLVLSVAVLAALAACSGSSRPKPTPLEDFKPSRTAQVAWSAKVGSAQGPLSLAVTPSGVAMASGDGQVVQFDA
ncbi:MAG: hypothetical protein RLZZ182_1239, partial [Pseudomonadota bacterium]